MNCPRCGSKMVVGKRTYHKKKKWVCPTCGRVRMEVVKKGTRERQWKQR